MTLQRRTYSLRPLAKPEADSFTLEGSFRVYMAAQDMTVDNLATGDLICIQSESTGRRGIGIAWRATDSLGSGNKSQGNPVIRVSDLLRSSFSFELRDGYSITKWHGQLPKAQEITITIQTTDAGTRHKSAYNPKELEFWITTGLGKNSVGLGRANALQSRSRQLLLTELSTSLLASAKRRKGVRGFWLRRFFQTARTRTRLFPTNSRGTAKS
jgi:hypothetical protein